MLRLSKPAERCRQHLQHDTRWRPGTASRERPAFRLYFHTLPMRANTNVKLVALYLLLATSCAGFVQDQNKSAAKSEIVRAMFPHDEFDENFKTCAVWPATR